MLDQAQVYGPYVGLSGGHHPSVMPLPVSLREPPIVLPTLESTTEKKYSVHSMFRTIQSEGYHAGKLAVFIRFSGCNVWSGKEEDRERDSKKGSCARFCDTEFFGVDKNNGGGRFTAEELVKRANDLWDHHGQQMFVVFTGGEPSLQVDRDLVVAFQEGCLPFPYLAMETNGSKEIHSLCLNWVTLSPKPPTRVNPENLYSEVKVLYPEYDPLHFYLYASCRYIQPVDPPKTGAYLDLYRDNMRKCVEFVHKHPDWCISIQQHKVLGIP